MPVHVMLRALGFNEHVEGFVQHASISPEMHAARGAVVQLPVNLEGDTEASAGDANSLQACLQRAQGLCDFVCVHFDGGQCLYCIKDGYLQGPSLETIKRLYIRGKVAESKLSLTHRISAASRVVIKLSHFRSGVCHGRVTCF